MKVNDIFMEICHIDAIALSEKLDCIGQGLVREGADGLSRVSLRVGVVWE